jgi:chemotaxis protein MotB
VLAKVSYETVTFIDTDGHRYVNYATTRSAEETYSVFMDKAASLDDYLFVSPNSYQFDESSSENNILRFQQGSYALMSQGDYIDTTEPAQSAVTVDDEGVYTLSTWDGRRHSNGHYGYWNTPDNYANFASAWVFPKHFDVLEYYSNRDGEWVRRGNALAFFANDTNDLTFEIRYRARSSHAYRTLKAQLQGIDSVDIEQTEDRVTVIMKNEILFASGSASLSDTGEQLLMDLASSLGDSSGYDVIVEGHTDDVPISGALAEIYPTNWELSSKRALNVVHTLSSAGISPYRLQARAFGPFKPRTANDSKINRMANRRIELIIKPRA